MGKKFRKLALAFVDSIPNHKLVGGFPTKPSTLIHKGENFRLDMQSLTTERPQHWNIQVQCNKDADDRIVCKAAKASKNHNGGASICAVQVPTENPWAPDVIKRELKAKIEDYDDHLTQPQQRKAKLLQQEGRIDLALQAYESGQFKSVHLAALAYNVPHQRLSDRQNKITFRLSATPNGRKLSATEEQTIVR
ncbi:hypothetical protein EJ07DRAFT_172034 [Lizonia empirigonia]|nr:hypothetical protein EJ07DRAFT_172034 [Lizonia empirigonia]